MSIDCTRGKDRVTLTEIPIDVEVLLTVNTTSFSETERSKRAVVEISPVPVGPFQRNRLNLLSQLSKLTSSIFDETPLKPERGGNPDPLTRIETVATLFCIR
jgi:hypothetical protein